MFKITFLSSDNKTILDDEFTAEDIEKARLLFYKVYDNLKILKIEEI